MYEDSDEQSGGLSGLAVTRKAATTPRLYDENMRDETVEDQDSNFLNHFGFDAYAAR